mgnify:CR=1 FL=1
MHYSRHSQRKLNYRNLRSRNRCRILKTCETAERPVLLVSIVHILLFIYLYLIYLFISYLFIYILFIYLYLIYFYHYW